MLYLVDLTRASAQIHPQDQLGELRRLIKNIFFADFRFFLFSPESHCLLILIFQDNLLPLYWQLVDDYKNGNIIVICTARELGKWDLEYIHQMGIYYDYIISRPLGIDTIDNVLKWKQCQHFFNFKQFKKLKKVLYDDNVNTLTTFFKKGCEIVNAKIWNDKFNS